jgi:hypothetical protein
MAEQVFLDEAGISVGNAMFKIPGKTYQVRNINGVGTLIENPSRKWPIILFLLGVAGFAAGAPGVVFAIAFIALGVFLWIRNKPKYWVQLSMSSGEAKAYGGTDQAFIERVVQALNEAMTHVT